MTKVILLSKNYEKYISGYYHQDLVDAFCKFTNAFLYGSGYPGYNKNDTIADVISKSPFKKANIDLIVCSTTWDVDYSMETVDPHPKIDLSHIDNIFKVYFLNKEYKKLNLRFEYIKKQKINLVCTVHPDASKWEKEIGVKFLHLPFGISLERFKDYGLPKKWDFGFTGSLHKQHTDYRFLVKKEFLKPESIHRLSIHGLPAIFKPHPLKEKYKEYKIFWAEFEARDFLFRSLLPKGIKYAKFLNQFKVFLNTPSASGIFNTRFLELMAVRTLILCPESDSYVGILKDNTNCLMFKPDLSDFEEKLGEAIENEDKRKNIVENACKEVKNHSYEERLKKLLNNIKGDL